MNLIEKIKIKRAPIRSAVTKLITKIPNYIENNSDDVENILELQDQLIEKELSLKQLNSEMENLIVDVSEFKTEINASEEYSEKIISIKYKIKSYIKRRECNLNVPNSTQVWSDQTRTQLSIKLPKNPLPKFSGKFEEWSNFKIQFNNIIATNSQLSSEQKLYYLKAALTSEAKNLETVSDSFESLFKSLEERYENKRLIVETHVKASLNLANLNNESAKELRYLIDDVKKNMRALKELADPNFGVPGKTDLLIGAEAFFDIIKEAIIRTSDNALVFRSSVFGYIATGTTHSYKQNQYCGFISEMQNIDDNLQKFWEIETINEGQKPLSKEEEYCENHYQMTPTRNNAGRYVVQMPVKDIQGLGHSKGLAMKRLDQLWRKLSKDKQMENLYREFICSNT
ncbi:DUF1758 domain-containing protein [Trichonephila clavipes]|nr:DUF1758 domain-containing protein [Trichonephila clavipes]